MGTLQFAGIKAADADYLAKQWRLKPGDVFDASYVAKYRADVLRDVQARARVVAKIELGLDRASGVVNVRVVFP